MEEGGSQRIPNWRQDCLTPYSNGSSTKRSFSTMAQGQRSHIHNHSHTGSLSDDPLQQLRPIFDNTTGLVNERSLPEPQPHAHQSLSAELQRHLQAAGQVTSALQTDAPHLNSRQNNPSSTAHRHQLALPLFSSPRTSEIASTYPRYPGDGLDFRRPIMSNGEARTRPSQVVDLTGDEDLDVEPDEQGPANMSVNGSSDIRRRGLPRFSRDIIDVEDEPTGSGAIREHSDLEWFETLPSSRQPTSPADGDDVVITDARPINPAARHPRPLSRRPTPTQRSVIPPLATFDDLIDLTDDSDEVTITDTRQRDRVETQGVNVQRPAVTAGYGTRALSGQAARIADLLREQPRLISRMEAMGIRPGQMMPMLGQNPPYHHDRHHHQAGPGVHSRSRNGAVHGHRPRRMDMPAMMDYQSIGFDLGIAGGSGLPPAPTYSPPSKAPEGFTSNPAEEEVVVCPNCGDELAVGGKGIGDLENDIKQQIWVIKKCGHAYCGTCANRKGTAGARGKGKGKEKVTEDDTPQPLKRCVVEGCGQPAVKNSFVHVYLSQ